MPYLIYNFEADYDTKYKIGESTVLRNALSMARSSCRSKEITHRNWIIEKIAADGTLLNRRTSTAGNQVTQFAVELKTNCQRPQYACARCGNDFALDRGDRANVGFVNIPDGKGNRIHGALCTKCFHETVGKVMALSFGK